MFVCIIFDRLYYNIYLYEIKIHNLTRNTVAENYI